MKDIIKELFRIESEANELIMEANKEMAALDEQMRYKEAEIRGNIDKQTDEKINRLSVCAHQESAQRISQIKQKSDCTITAMEKMYEQNRSRWAADIVNQVIEQ